MYTNTATKITRAVTVWGFLEEGGKEGVSEGGREAVK